MRTVCQASYVKYGENRTTMELTCEMSLHQAAFSCSVDATRVMVTGGPLRESIVMRNSRPLYSTAAAAACGRADMSVVVSKLLVGPAEF